MECYKVQYRRNHRSASGNCRLKNDVLHSEKTENGSTSVTQIQGLSSVQERRYTQKGDESLKRWKPVPELQTESHLKEPEETFLHSNWHLKEKRAEDHPLYAAEWKSFWERRQQHFKLNEKDSLEEDFMPDWIKHWNNLMNDLDLDEEMKTQETNHFKLKRKSHEDEFHVSKRHNSDCGNGTPELLGQRWSLKKSPDHKKKLNLLDSKNKNLLILPQSVEPQCGITLREPSSNPSEDDTLNSKRICHVIPLQIPKDASSLSSDPDLLQVLRMLVALEDNLGSLGPSITNLLTRALSAERCKIGSSSKLLKDDTTCVDLLDTSKEKLKGLILAGILDGVKGTAASQAVEYVTRLLRQSSNTSDSSTSVNAPAVGFDMASLINNLPAAGLLNPPQSTPMLSSAIRSDSVAEVKNKDSTLRTNNLYGSDFKKNDRFTGEELKTLIINFRTLTESQKRDLVEYLRKLEEAFAENDLTNPTELGSPVFSSPLSKKNSLYEIGKVTNPTAPDRPLSKIRFPFISKKTGLSPVDLDNFGIPLEELDPRPKMSLNRLSIAQGNKGILLTCVNYQPCPTGITYHSNPNKSPFIQSSHAHQQPLQVTEMPLPQDRNGIEQQQQELNAVQLQKLSFYHDSLDPRRNRIMYNRLLEPQPRRTIGDFFINSPYCQEPIIIPVSRI